MDTLSSSVVSFNSYIFNTGVTIYASVVNQCFKWLKTHYLKTEQYRNLLLYAFFSDACYTTDLVIYANCIVGKWRGQDEFFGNQVGVL